jgi:hypothetical protein
VADSPTRWHSFTFEGIKYLVYERLPFDGRSRAQLALDPHPGAKCAPEAGKLRDRALGFPNPCRHSGG